MIGAMILAAGRGERMRPLTDAMPKPLLEAGGKALIVWQIESLARAGCTDIVINAAHLADKLVSALGDGAAFGVRLAWSIEPEPLEAAGGIATALPLLPRGPALIVSGDVWSGFDYATLLPRAEIMARDPASPRISSWSRCTPRIPQGDFVLRGDAAACGR
jgi:MurNAc alpha-1-phosphate uridylyltransferase